MYKNIDRLNKTLPLTPSSKHKIEAKEELSSSFTQTIVYPAYWSLGYIIKEFNHWKESFENWQIKLAKKKRLFTKKVSKSRVKRTSEMRSLNKFSKTNMDYEDNMDD